MNNQADNFNKVMLNELVPQKKIFIVAIDSARAAAYALKNMLRKHQWSYVVDVDNLKGLRDVEIHFVGEWYKHRNYYEIAAETDRMKALGRATLHFVD